MNQSSAKKTLKESRIGKKRTRFSLLHLTIIFFVISVFVVISFFFFNRQVNLLLKQQSSFYLQEVAIASADRLKEKLDGDRAKLKGIALALSGLDELDHEYWVEELTEDSLLGDMQGFGFILPNGKAYSKQFSDLDVSDRDYFNSVMQGNSILSDVLIDRVYNKPVLFYIEPIIQKGVVVGAVTFGIMTQEFEKYLLLPSFKGEGTMHLMDCEGSMILKLGNASIPKRIPLESLQEKFATQKSGIIHLEGNNNPRILAYAPVGVKCWNLLLEVPTSFLMKTQKQTTLYSLVMTVIFGLLIVIFLYSTLLRRKKYEYSLLELVYIDQLTGIANYTLFVENAEILIKKKGPKYACVVLNVRRFKLINDLFGYTYGDTLLKQIASTLPLFCSKDELFARKEVDRFILFLKQDEAEERVQALLATMNQIPLPDTARFKLEIEGGIFFMQGPLAVNICIDRAALALDHLKGVHGRRYMVYDDAIRKQLLGESELIKDFQEALDTDQFFVLLQPKFNMMTEEMIGAEALVRWNHPTRGFLSPLQFIPVLEENNLITELDMFVLRKVCEKLYQWQGQGLALLPISVNQSRAHLDNPHYISDILQVVGQFSLDHTLLEFELTENIFLKNLDRLKVVVESLRREGFCVSIDDFGSGYSSLNMLKNIPIDYLKLDREFLMQEEDHIRSQKVIHSIIDMAHDLGILVIAEGVETRSQAEMLKAMGCTLAQGYYYERPIAIEAFEKLLVELP